MQVKIFEAEDMSSGLRMVKESLGPDALIISTRTVKSSKLGLLGKSTLEITAAIDEPQTTNARPPVRRTMTRTPQTFQDAKKTVNYVVDDSLDTTEIDDLATYGHPYKPQTQQKTARQDINNSPQDEATKPMFVEQIRSQSNHQASFASSAFATPSASEEKLIGEVEDLKQLVKTLAGEVARLQPNSQNIEPNVEIPTPEKIISNVSTQARTESLLQDNGVSEEISKTISHYLKNSLNEEALSDDRKVRQSLIQSIQSMIEVAPPFQSEEGQQRISFVGPTGVGKTTTLAKLAASRLSNGHRSIALITIDTYRIAAVEQLKVYGEIMNLPVDVVISPEQLESALLKHRDCDLILIDTAGRSPKDDFSIDELSTFLKPELNIENHLVLSATAREIELLDTIERFSKLDIYSTIYTKLDECSNLGTLLNVQTQNHSPISCLTNGQRVPEDLLELSPQRIAELIISSN